MIDTLQCKVKRKELRQEYHKAREANRRSGAAPKTCRFYKELEAIFGGDPTSTAKSPVDTLEGTEAAEREPNPEDEEVELDDDVELPVGQAARNRSALWSCLASLSSCSPVSKKQERRRLMWPSGTPHIPAECLHQIRKCPRRSKKDMFQEVLHSSKAEKRERKEWREAEREDRKENQEFVKDATEQMIKVMEEQTQMLKSLIMLQTEQMNARPPLQHTRNSFTCPPQNSARTVFSGSSQFPLHFTPSDNFQNDSW
ncbi:hypothetical protein G0U57_005780, partial [Chelydra serpentina]